MRENKTPGIWKWAVLLLVLCNAGLLLTIWLKPRWEGNRPRPETPRDYIIRNLQFTGEQIKRYDALINDHQQAMRQLRREAMGYRSALFGNLKNEPAGNADSLAQLIANNQKQTELVTYRHFAAVRKICTDAQKVTFDKIINDVIKKMNGGMRPGPSPGDKPGPPPPDDDHPDDRQGPPPGAGQNP